MTIISPVITDSPPEFSISQAEFSTLERAGGVQLQAELRQRLRDLCRLWQHHLVARASPRPKQFRDRLEKIRTALQLAHAALNLNGEDASTWERHLFNWAANTRAEGSKSFFEDARVLLTHMHEMAELMLALENELPSDRGGYRKHDDETFLQRIADIYEEAGGNATAYNSELSPEGIANTPFRAFAQAFYGLIPGELKRTRAGLDVALQTALRTRRPERS